MEEKVLIILCVFTTEHLKLYVMYSTYDYWILLAGFDLSPEDIVLRTVRVQDSRTATRSP